MACLNQIISSNYCSQENLDAHYEAADCVLPANMGLVSPRDAADQHETKDNPQATFKVPSSLRYDSRTANTNSSGNLTHLPNELIQNIIHQIDDSRLSICLGLTCRRFYAAHRVLYPEPISLRIGSYGIENFGYNFFEPFKLLEGFMERGGYEFDEDIGCFRKDWNLEACYLNFVKQMALGY